MSSVLEGFEPININEKNLVMTLTTNSIIFNKQVSEIMYKKYIKLYVSHETKRVAFKLEALYSEGSILVNSKSIRINNKGLVNEFLEIADRKELPIRIKGTYSIEEKILMFDLKEELL